MDFYCKQLLDLVNHLFCEFRNVVQESILDAVYDLHLCNDRGCNAVGDFYFRFSDKINCELGLLKMKKGRKIKYDPQEVREFYSQYGNVNSIGETLLGKNGFDPNGVPGIKVTFEKLNRGVKIASIPRQFQGCLVHPEKIGKIVPLRAK